MLAISLSVLGFLNVVNSQLHTETQYQFLFKQYISRHNKKYHVDEFQDRYENFKLNLDKIVINNADSKKSFKLETNAFADMSSDDFRAKYLGYNFIDRSVLRSRNTESFNVRNVTDLPLSVDWVEKGAVTPVKNQGQCGSCWAFSTTGAVEGAWFLSKGQLVSLSEQQLVDCSQQQGNQGCSGGLMDQGFQYIISNGGLCEESSYPYVAVDGKCNTNCKKVATISTFTDVTANDENALLDASSQQPVSIAIEADQFVFQFYSSGVLDDDSCGTQLDHGVLLTGYGHDSNVNKDFWTVKNSWGPEWGTNGYINIVRNVNGDSARQCGLTSDPSYPSV